MISTNPSIQPIRANRHSRHAALLGLSVAVAVAVVWGCGEDESTGPSGLQPTLNAIDPDSGTVSTQVRITGSNFEGGAAVSFGNYPSLLVEVVSPTEIRAHAPDSLRAGNLYDVQVTNPGGKSHALPTAYRAVPPNLQVVNGVSKPSGIRGSTIIFEGRAFGDLANKGTVWFTDAGGLPVAAEVASNDNWTNEFIVTTVPNAAESGPVWVETQTGESRTIDFRISEGSTFSPSQIFWTPTSPLPEPSQGHDAVFLSGEEDGTDNLVYVAGGADGTMIPRADVWQTTVSQVGELSAWLPETSLPEERAFHGMVVATPFNALIDTTAAGHLYVVGGLDADGLPTMTVFRSEIAIDRSMGTWIEEMPLPEPLHSMGVTIFRSWLYVAGGATTGNAAVASVYRARIEFDGSLGSWESQPTLPGPVAYGKLAQFAGILYMLGGDSGTIAPEVGTVSSTQTPDIHYAHLDLRTGVVRDASWSLNPSGMIKAVAKHSALVAGGTVLVSGGLYNGDDNSATEHQYASINLDGTIASFGGATGSQTIGSSSGAGGHPFFNHAAIVYVDGTGEAHVVILGGNNVNDPTTPVAENYYY